jgi:cobalt-zinc-cadmium efflux system membrane fusion protein
MTIADLKTVWVTASVPEADTTLVAKGQPVSVTLPAYPGEVFKGSVLFVSDVVDTDTRRTKVRIDFANPDTRLRPGMFANVTFFAPAQTVAVVPTRALDVRGPHRRSRLPAGRPGHPQERREAGRAHRRQGRSAAR